MIEKFFKKPSFKREEEKTPRPPEPEYFDPPPPTVGEASHAALKNPWVQIGVGVLFLILVGFFTLSGSNEEKQKRVREVTPTEKREVITVSSMERAIEASRKTKNSQKVRVNEREQKQSERKYDTGMAVFVAAPERKEKEKLERKKEEPKALGLPSGTKIPAVITDQIFSFNVEAPVIAVLPKNFMREEKVILPEGTKFLCEAQVMKSVDRINASCDLMVFPSGEEHRVRGLLLDEGGVAGIRGRVDKHTDRRVLKAIGESLLAGTSLFVGGRSSASEPFALQDQFRLNLAQNLTEEAKRDLRASKVEKSITTEPETRVQVMLLEAV